MKTVTPTCLTLIVLSLPALSQVQPTVTLSPAVKQAHVLHAGINVDDGSYLLKDNFLFDNQGFEQPTVAVTINCAVLTGTICISDDPYARWPDGFAGNFTYRPQVAGDSPSGTVLYSVAATGSQGVTFYLSDAPTTTHLIVEGTFPSSGISDISGWLTQGSGTGRTESFDVGDGQQSVLLDGSNGYAQLLHYFDNQFGIHSGTQLNAPYELRFLAKPGTSTSVTVDVMRFTANGNEVMLHQTQQLSQGWQQYVIPFTPTENGTQIGTGRVLIEADNGTVLLDDISMPRVEAGNPTPFRKAALTSLQALQPGSLRFMIAPGYGVRLDDAIAPMNLRRPALHAVTDTQAQVPSVDYFQAMQLAQAVGARPWITIPLTTTQAEMANLVEWLAGSSATPYGAKRAARGQAAPWTSVFNTIFLEYGNEDWNAGVDGNNQNDPETYGRRANDVFTAAHNSSSWTGGITLVADGWSTSASDAGTELFWEQHVRQHITVPFMMSEAPYLYTSYNDGSSIEAIYGPMYAQVQTLNDPNGGLTQQAVADLRANGDDIGIYEENLGTNFGNASQDQFDKVTSTWGSGLAVADNMLQLTALGIQTQNLFDYSGLAYRLNTGQIANLWGSIIDAGGATNNVRPTYLAELLVNKALLPTMLTTTQANDPTYNMPGSSNDALPPIPNVKNLRSYAFTDGAQTSLVLMNMSRTASITPALIGFPGSAPSSVIRLTSANITDTNELSALVAPVDITEQWSGPAISLPPFSMTTILWNAGAGTSAQPVAPAPPSPPPAAPALPASPVLALGSGNYASAIIDQVTGPAGSFLYFTSDGSLPTPTHGYSCLRSLCAAGPMGSLTPFTAVACINGLCSAPTYATYQFGPDGKLVAPRILSNSGDQTIAAGAPASFSATIFGSYPFQFSWTRNGVLTPSSTSANAPFSFTAQTVYQLADDGAQFAPAFSNGAGSVTGQPLVLHVVGGTGQGAPGSIASPTLALGSGVYAGPIVDNVSGPPGSLLYFTSDGSLPTPAHGYSCGHSVCAAGPMASLTPFTAVACGNGLCSAPVYATYQFDPSGRTVAPQISYNSGDQTVNPGGSASFFSVMYGSWPFSASWTRNGIVTASAIVPNGVASFTPQAAYQVTDDGAQFIATLGNSAGSITDQPLTLHVAGGSGQGAPTAASPAPAFSLGGGTYAGGYGAGLVENITGPAGTTVVWTTDGSAPNAAHGTSCAGAVCSAGPLLTDTTLTAVTCKGAVCSLPSVASYTIRYGARAISPRLSKGTGNQTVTPGSAVTVMAAPYGTYPFAASWTKNGVTVPSYLYNYDLATSVTQNSFQVQDDGNQFAVTFTNEAGSFTAPSTTIQVVGGSGQGAPR